MEAYAIEKIDTYGHAVIAELAQSGISYMPIVASCFGRRSGAFSSLLKVAASKAARLRGASSFNLRLRRWHLHIGVAVMRRAANLAMRCLPGGLVEGD